MESTILLVAVAALIMLAVASMRYGVDSREDFTTKERELAAHGIARGGSLPTRGRHSAPIARRPRLNRLRQEPNDGCLTAHCGA